MTIVAEMRGDFKSLSTRSVRDRPRTLASRKQLIQFQEPGGHKPEYCV